MQHACLGRNWKAGRILGEPWADSQGKKQIKRTISLSTLAKVFHPSCNQFRWQPISLVLSALSPRLSTLGSPRMRGPLKWALTISFTKNFIVLFLSTVQIWLQFVKDCGFQAILVSYVHVVLITKHEPTSSFLGE